MNNILFRAWNEETKQMLYPDPLSNSWGTVDSKGNITEIPAIMTWTGQVYIHAGGGRWKPQDNIILLQYCKCNDTKGKKIFQGDIIKETYAKSEREPEYRVVYNIVISNDITVFSAEVVGNIYENPELALTLAGQIK